MGDELLRQRRSRLDVILADFDARLDPGTQGDLRVEDLYDEAGLPA